MLSQLITLAAVSVLQVRSSVPPMAQVNPPSTSAGDRTASSDVPPQYRSIDIMRFLEGNDISTIQPRAIAAQLLSRSTSLEGRQEEIVEIDYDTGDRDTVVVEYTVIGLADTSVRSQRTRIELQWIGHSWTVRNIGQQYQCQPRRGHQNWSGELCS